MQNLIRICINRPYKKNYEIFYYTTNKEAVALRIFYGII